MSEQTPGPLHQAQQLIAELQHTPTLDPGDLKSRLSQLDALLRQAVAHGDGQEAESLRQRLDETLGNVASFNSMMVHEIRKPMTSIRGYADMLAKPGMIGPLNEMQQQFIDTIPTNVIRMEGLVSDISDICKLNAGRYKLASQMPTFGQISMRVLNMAAPPVTDFQQNVTWEVPQGLPILNA